MRHWQRLSVDRSILLLMNLAMSKIAIQDTTRNEQMPLSGDRRSRGLVSASADVRPNLPGSVVCQKGGGRVVVALECRC